MLSTQDYNRLGYSRIAWVRPLMTPAPHKKGLTCM